MDRRGFLKELGLVGGSGVLLAMFPWLQSCSDEARREVAGEKARLAIVGTGSRGQYHIQNLLNTPEAEIVALCDIYPPHLAEAAALCPGAKCYSDFDELLKDTNVQGLVIAVVVACSAVDCGTARRQACFLRKGDGLYGRRMQADVRCLEGDR